MCQSRALRHQLHYQGVSGCFSCSCYGTHGAMLRRLKFMNKKTTLSAQARSQMLDGSPEKLRTQIFRGLQIKSTAPKLYGASQESVCK